MNILAALRFNRTFLFLFSMSSISDRLGTGDSSIRGSKSLWSSVESGIMGSKTLVTVVQVRRGSRDSMGDPAGTPDRTGQ